MKYLIFRNFSLQLFVTERMNAADLSTSLYWAPILSCTIQIICGVLWCVVDNWLVVKKIDGATASFVMPPHII